MAIKYFKKTNNGEIDIPTLKQYNYIDYKGIVTPPTELTKDLPIKYLPYEGLTVPYGSEVIHVIETSDIGYKVNILNTIQLSESKTVANFMLSSFDCFMTGPLVIRSKYYKAYLLSFSHAATYVAYNFIPKPILSMEDAIAEKPTDPTQQELWEKQKRIGAGLYLNEQYDTGLFDAEKLACPEDYFTVEIKPTSLYHGKDFLEFIDAYCDVFAEALETGMSETDAKAAATNFVFLNADLYKISVDGTRNLMAKTDTIPSGTIYISSPAFQYVYDKNSSYSLNYIAYTSLSHTLIYDNSTSSTIAFTRPTHWGPWGYWDR